MKQLILTLLEQQSAQLPIYKTRITAVGIHRANHATPFIRKSWLNSPTSYGRFVGIILSRTKATELLVISTLLHEFPSSLFCNKPLDTSGTNLCSVPPSQCGTLDR
jgi:hypothetical protein